ncbi:MarR family transcriptional regulator [Chitinophaga silvatica]|uniref:MarR family transcriptional regulator n=1 Tax=Chitinophaga silvatica TaxID=2282649 RepID=A0A3E1Y342_9BACT|nr:MarR family transcriptional regulator [Chitinophaga silvatica]RFS19082.1 MarR family transcriptional regulator [Chitinophaga silvatica]
MRNSEITERLRLNIASAVIRTHTAYRLKLLQVFMQAGIDITPDMYFVLKYLWAGGDGSKQQELANKTGKDKASLTKLLDNLEKRELVQRTTDERDKRSKRIWLTLPGKRLKEKVYPLALSVVELAEQGVAHIDLQQAQSILEMVYNNIKR